MLGFGGWMLCALCACSAVESFGEDVSRLGTAGRQWIADVGGDDPRVDSDY